MKDNNREISLWNGLRDGNEKDLHSIYTLYYKDLLRYGLYLTGDFELSTEYINLVFLSLWTKRQKLVEIKNPKAFIITCYKNKIIFRKNKAGDLAVIYPDNEKMYSESVASAEDTLIELQEFDEMKRKIKSLLEGLTERQRQLIVLRFIEEMSYEEISAMLHISVRTVYNSIHESLKLLRKQTSKKHFHLFSFLLMSF